LTSWQSWAQNGIIFSELGKNSKHKITNMTKWQVKHSLKNIIEDFAFPTMIHRGDGPCWTRQLRAMISPDHAHALTNIIAPFKCGLAPHLQLKMLELRAGCWDGHRTSTNTTCPQWIMTKT
jgi:hypothetical protein